MIVRTKIEMLSDFMNGINIMSDACSQMVHSRQNPKFMALRDMLNIVRDNAADYVKGGGASL
jgi:hypothetical protein